MNNKKGFATLAIVLIAVVVLAAAGGIWYYEARKSSTPSVAVNLEGQSPTSTPLSQATTTQTALSSMNKYTDSNFGFSFWYPSAWTVQDVPVTNPAAYGDGIIIKDVRVQTPTSTDIDHSNIIIDFAEFHSASDTITFPGEDCPTTTCYNFSSPLSLYFDLSLHTWMIEYPKGEATSKGVDIPADSPMPADVSHNTMGGLHIIGGLVPYDYAVVVPLSAKNFLVASIHINSESPYDDAIIKTIVATDPAVAVPVSQAEQSSTIQAVIDYYNNLKAISP
jgi:hypothetical protein